MARFPSSLRSRRRRRLLNRIYLVTALLVAGVVVAFVFGGNPFGKNKPEPPGPAITPSAGQAKEETVPAMEEQPNPPAALSSSPELVEPRSEAPPPSLVPTEVAEPNPKVAKLILKALDCIKANPSRIIEAREILNQALLLPMNAQQQQFVKQQLSELADKWLFSSSVFPEDRLCGSYRVKPGDQLLTIGQKFKVPYEILLRINNIARPESLQAGQTIKIIQGPFHAKVYRSSFTMDLYLQKTFVKSFRVGLGKPGMETPTGLWLVKPGGKLIKPIWTDPISGKTYHPDSPDYPLGSRWIGLEGIEGQAKGRTGFAIHGTKDPTQIGTASSQGCIRMYNGDVILMYELLMPGYSTVRVVE